VYLIHDRGAIVRALVVHSTASDKTLSNELFGNNSAENLNLNLNTNPNVAGEKKKERKKQVNCVAIDHKAANRERCTIHRVIDKAGKIAWNNERGGWVEGRDWAPNNGENC